MNAKLLTEARYPADWVFSFKPIPEGAIVPVVPASNIPEPGCVWVNTPELEDDAYGILLYPGDFELVNE